MYSIVHKQYVLQWMESEEGKESIKTGSDAADQIITVLLSTSMFVAMFLGFVLDNTIPGNLLLSRLTSRIDFFSFRREFLILGLKPLHFNYSFRLLLPCGISNKD